MEIVKPTPYHVHDFIDLCKSFFKEGIDPYGMGLNRDNAEATYFQWIKTQPGFMLEHDGKIIGCIAGLIVAHWLDYKTLCFMEYIWYVLPEHRKSRAGLMLLRAMQKELEKRGVKKMVMGHAHSMKAEHLEKLYTKMGFVKLETHYIKDVNHG